MTKNVAIYLRVSTSQQAKHDISLTDQRRQAEGYCNARGWTIVKEYVEAKSGTDDNRPVFQSMINDGCNKNHPFDVVLVYAFSRFFRNAIDSGIYRRKLEKHDVSVQSVTQDFGDGHDGELLKNIIAAVDQHFSAENGKNVLSRMLENTRQGFWNGAMPPFGYKTITAEIRDKKEKKKLQIHPEEAQIVRSIFDAYLNGIDGSGSMGVKAIAVWLNERGYRNRRGKPFYTSNIHTILTRTTYFGEHYYNTTCHKTKKSKPREDWILLKSPIIILKDKFEQVQRLLKSKQQNVTAPRNLSGCTLLGGIAKCARCNSHYKLMASGKGKQYRYYKSSARLFRGNNACDCKNFPEKFLNDLVIDEISNNLLKPDYLFTLIKDLSEHNKTQSEHVKNDLKLLNQDFRDTEKRLNNLYDTVAQGKVANFDTLSDFIQKENTRLESLRQQISTKKQQQGQSYKFSNRQVKHFTDKLKNMLQNSSTKFKKQTLKDFVDEILITDNEMHIIASKSMIAQTLQAMKEGGKEKVRTSVREWCGNPNKSANLVHRVKLPERYHTKADFDK